LDYPNGFNIKSFPAGKTIAFSRSVSIWISIAFFLIVALCGFLLLGVHLKSNFPFLISIDPYTNEWSVITYPGKNDNESIQQYQIVQEKLVRDFITDWFTISGTAETNEKRWKQCEIEDCSEDNQFNPDNLDCAIYCKSDISVFEEFTNNVLPDYIEYANANGKWTVARMLITPNVVTQNSGTWQVVTTVQPSMSAAFDVLSLITIEQDQRKYPATLGYHIRTFNSYRLTNE
jgi:hypothetical protein